LIEVRQGGVEYLLLLILALGAAVTLMAGAGLLYFYFRGSGGQPEYEYVDEPAPYDGAVPCPTCGAPNPPNAPVCHNCGRPLITPSAPPAYPAYAPPPALPPVQQTVARPRAERTLAAAHSAPPPPPPPPSPHRPADMPHAWIEGVGDALQGQRSVLIKADTLVGRSTACDIQVHDPKVSRRHFKIRYAQGAFFLQDQQSARGTSLNGARINAQRLRDGDRIELGDTTLVFRVKSD